MKFNLGEGIFIQTRLNPIRSKFVQIDEYPIKIIEKDFFINQEQHEIKLFDLNKFREQYNATKFKDENAQIDIAYDPALNTIINMKGE